MNSPVVKITGSNLEDKPVTICGWMNKEAIFIFGFTFLTLRKLNHGFRKEAKQYMRPAPLDSQEGGRTGKRTNRLRNYRFEI